MKHTSWPAKNCSHSARVRVRNSAAIRSSKQAEADIIRERLSFGDIRAGDDIKVEILAEPGLTAV